MEKSELFDLIESFLDNTLPEDKRSEVEHRMTVDEDFRREVELHRALQNTFSDQGRMKLRSTLSEIIKEPIPAEETSDELKHSFLKNHWKWIMLIAIIFTTVGLWYWLKPATEKSIEEPVETQPANQPSIPMANGSLDTIKTETPEENLPPSRESDDLLAAADPENFETNSSMEALVNSNSRSDDDNSITITSPVNNAAFIPDNKGETVIRFAGQLSGSTNDPRSELALHVFTNKDVTNALVSKTLEVKQDSDNLSFDVRLRMKSPKGLYYFTVEQDGDLVYTGKFTIGRLKK